jgi:hypothetical protein
VTDGKKIEGSCSTGQSPQRAVVTVEEERSRERVTRRFLIWNVSVDTVTHDLRVDQA